MSTGAITQLTEAELTANVDSLKKLKPGFLAYA